MKMTKKSISTLSIFILILLFINSGNFAFGIETNQITSFPQGFYTLDSLNLLPNIKYNVRNESNTENMFIVVFDGTTQISQSARVKPGENFSLAKPLQYGYIIVIVGKGQLSFYT